MTDLIEDYLDDLHLRLRGAPRDIRRTLRETEDHLADAVAAGLDAGLTPEAAERDAIERFGRPDDVARAVNRSRSGPRVRIGLLIEQAACLGGVALAAVGLSGVVAAVMIGIAGRAFVFADAPGRTYPASACRHWLALHPHAGDCARAALAEHVSDGLLQRFAAGVAGLVLLAALAWRIRRQGRSIGQVLGAPLVSIVGATAFGAAGAVLLAMGVDAVRVSGGNGAGQWFSAGGVSMIAAGLFAVSAARRLREIPGIVGREHLLMA
jgi:hypothetical protein